MNSQTIKEIVLDAISKRPKCSLKYYHICWWDDAIQCLPANHTKDQHHNFFGASDSTYIKGLSSYQFKLIEERITAFCKDRKINLCSKSLQANRKKTVRKRNIVITEFDEKRLKTLVLTAGNSKNQINRWLKRLDLILQRAEVVPPKKIQSNRVTMNSKFRLKDEIGNEEMELTLVFPISTAKEDTPDFEEFNVSILSPMGLSVFGRRTGDVIQGRVNISEILYQPEAEGIYDL